MRSPSAVELANVTSVLESDAGVAAGDDVAPEWSTAPARHGADTRARIPSRPSER